MKYEVQQMFNQGSGEIVNNSSTVDSQEGCMNTAKLTSSNVITPTKLSSREHEVLKLMVAGHSNPEIATMLYLGQSTVKTHVRGILNKLGVNHRVQAAVVALQIGLV